MIFQSPGEWADLDTVNSSWQGPILNTFPDHLLRWYRASQFVGYVHQAKSPIEGIEFRWWCQTVCENAPRNKANTAADGEVERWIEWGLANPHKVFSAYLLDSLR